MPAVLAAPLLAGFQPGRAGMAPPCGIRAHVRRAAEARDAIQRRGRAVAGEIDLQCRADEHVAGIVACRLRECAVRAHRCHPAR